MASVPPLSAVAAPVHAHGGHTPRPDVRHAAHAVGETAGQVSYGCGMFMVCGMSVVAALAEADLGPPIPIVGPASSVPAGTLLSHFPGFEPPPPRLSA